MKTLVLGAGAYGLALSSCISDEVVVYSSIKSEIDELCRTYKSKLFDVKLNSKIKFTSVIDFDYDFVIVALPTSVIKSELSKISLKSNVPVIIASKGLVDGKFVYDIVGDILDNPLYVLSGGGFARDLIIGSPTCLTLYGGHLDIFNSNIKLEYTHDLLGIEVCGVVKNIFAIGCGILEGIGASETSRAAFFNRVINETRSILDFIGADINTIFLSCGIGDIILTCTSRSSRNYTFGYMIGSGTTGSEVLEYLRSNTVEGVSAIKYFRDKVNNCLVDLIYDIIFNNVDSSEILKYVIK